jgi:hypothetical protein
MLGVPGLPLVVLATKHRIAVVSGRLFATAGGLIGYGNRTEDASHQIRLGHQPQDRQDTRCHYSAVDPRSR